MNENIIELKDICYAYEKEIALNHIDLNIRTGETIILQGPNGCGKSTLMKLLNGLIAPELGMYCFQGTEITEEKLKDSRFSKAFHQKVGYIFQDADVQLFCSSVYEEIAFGPLQMGLDENETETRVNDLLDLFGIRKLKDRAPYHLSGGEKRKVAFACVLSMNPDVLVIDEPLAGLDRNSQSFLIGFLQQLKSAGKTLIISTHNDMLANTLADRIVEMDENHRII